MNINMAIYKDYDVVFVICFFYLFSILMKFIV